VDGVDLHPGTRRPTSALEVARIVTTIASALGHCHSRGLVHGYVHPRHLLLGQPNSLWLIGFGEFPPGVYEVVGNPLHHAPEQFEFDPGARLTPQTDVYQLAECAFWFLTGHHPFQFVSGLQMPAAKRTLHPWTSDRGLIDHLPAGTEPVLRRAMQPDPVDRYPTPTEFAEAFTAAVRRGLARPWWRFW
jgi:serine/threonine protein kinase